jgi:hypothetical protein
LFHLVEEISERLPTSRDFGDGRLNILQARKAASERQFANLMLEGCPEWRPLEKADQTAIASPIAKSGHT